MEKALREALEPYSKKLYLYYDGVAKEYVYLNKIPTGPNDAEVERQISETETGKWNKLSSFTDETFRSEDFSETVQSQWYRELAEQKFDSPRDLIKYVAEFLNNVCRATDAQLDPSIKVKILKEVLESAAKCPGLETAAERFEEACLDKEFVINFDPFEYGKEAQANREIASAIWNEAGSLSVLLKGVEKEFEEAAAVSWPRYEWIGFIDAADGEASVKLGDSEAVRKKLAKSATLWIARGNSPAVRCGEFIDGKPELNSARDWAQYRWTPVYQRAEPNNQ